MWSSIFNGIDYHSVFIDLMTTPSDLRRSLKSRGHTLFDRQAQLHADDVNRLVDCSSTTLSDEHSSIPLCAIQSAPYAPSATKIYVHTAAKAHCQSTVPLSDVYSLNVHQHQHVSSATVQQDNVSNNITEGIRKSKSSEHFQETDFPFVDNSKVQQSNVSTRIQMPRNSVCRSMIEQAFNYQQIYDQEHADGSYESNHNDPIDTSNRRTYEETSYDDDDQSNGYDTIDDIYLHTATSLPTQNNSMSILHCDLFR
jgi:hypothetical protein